MDTWLPMLPLPCPAALLRAPPPQGYVDAARTFESESGTSPGVQLSTIMDRMEIRKAVQAGQVEEAIDKVNDLNPEVRTHTQPHPCNPAGGATEKVT